MDMDMGSMDSGGGSSAPLNDSGVDFSNYTQASDFLGEILDDTDFQVTGNQHARYFWYGVVSFIACFAIANLIRIAQSKSRLKAATQNQSSPTKPLNPVMRAIATYTAIVRELSNAQYTPISPRISRLFKVPPTGVCLIIIVHFAWVILLEFMNNGTQGAQHFTSLGVRAAWLAVSQVPLLILLAGKNNLIGLISGISYERLNVLHRWTARIFLFLVTLHMLFLHLAWNAYGLMSLEYSTDTCIPTGWATYVILLWMNLSTLVPFRNMGYEFFVIQHIITWIGFLVAVMYHLPSTALYSRVYIYIPIGLYFVDRVIRSARYAYHNIRPARATLIPLDGGVTKICVKSRNIKKWAPGSHVFISVPKFGIAQSHPATIASVPTSHDGDLVFLLKAHRGFTGRLLKTATVSQIAVDQKPAQGDRKAEEAAQPAPENRLTLIDGPYGASNVDFATFDTTILIAGSTGVTFTLPILLDLAARAKATRLPLRSLKFVWVVKNTSWTSWISEELKAAFTQLEAAGIRTSVDVYVTCDEAFAGEDLDNPKIQNCACDCDKTLGSCCCVNVSDDAVEDGAKDEDKQAASNVETTEKGMDVDVSSSKSSASISTGRNSGTPLTGVKSRVLPCALFHSGRPRFREMLMDQLERALGETGVAVCGPLGLSSEVRRTVVWCSNERAVHKGTGAQGVYLHAECFGW